MVSATAQPDAGATEQRLVGSSPLAPVESLMWVYSPPFVNSSGDPGRAGSSSAAAAAAGAKPATTPSTPANGFERRAARARATAPKAAATTEPGRRSGRATAVPPRRPRGIRPRPRGPRLRPIDACVHAIDACVHADDSCVHADNPCVHADDARVHADDSCVHPDNARVHADNVDGPDNPDDHHDSDDHHDHFADDHHPTALCRRRSPHRLGPRRKRHRSRSGLGDDPGPVAVIDFGTRHSGDAEAGSGRLPPAGARRHREAAIRALSNNPAVAFVEPNYRVSLAGTPMIRTTSVLWGWKATTLRVAYGSSEPPTTWLRCRRGLGSGIHRLNVVTVALDEGMQITHPDLAANIWVNPGEVAGDGIDNDGNGYADDVNGWDFYHRDSTVYDVGEDAHGTHVAGTIGATGNNGVGVAGVCSNVTIIPAKFLGPQGGYISDAITAMNYLVDLKARYDMKLVAANNSWGGCGYSSAMQGAINRAAKADILFVAAAGNSTSNNDATANYPEQLQLTGGVSRTSPLPAMSR